MFLEERVEKYDYSKISQAVQLLPKRLSGVIKSNSASTKYFFYLLFVGRNMCYVAIKQVFGKLEKCLKIFFTVIHRFL